MCRGNAEDVYIEQRSDDLLLVCLSLHGSTYMDGSSKYVTSKTTVEFNALLTLVRDARKHIDAFKSRADDADTSQDRRARHFMQR
jgi:hypothetical protein